MLEKSRALKTTPKLQKKVTRTDSDVSLSESLYDSLFSEDDGKADDTERSKNKTRNKSLDVSEVVTACLDNMAAKTGITKIQKQSHMDRWLQKAKSQTPEKVNVKTQVVKVIKINKNKKWKIIPKDMLKPYSLRRSGNESHTLLFNQNEHDYSKVVPDILKEQIEISNVDKIETASDINSKVKINIEKSNDVSKSNNLNFGTKLEMTSIVMKNDTQKENNRIHVENVTDIEVTDANKDNIKSFKETNLELNTTFLNGSPQFITDKIVEDLNTQTNSQFYLASKIVRRNEIEQPGTNQQSFLTNSITEPNELQPIKKDLNYDNNIKFANSILCIENESMKNIKTDTKIEKINTNGSVSNLIGKDCVGDCNVSDSNSISNNNSIPCTKAGPYSQDLEANFKASATKLNETVESCIFKENFVDDKYQVKINLTNTETDVANYENVDRDVNKKMGVNMLKDGSSLNGLNICVTDSINRTFSKKGDLILSNFATSIETTKIVENNIALDQSEVTNETDAKLNKKEIACTLTKVHSAMINEEKTTHLSANIIEEPLTDVDKETSLNNDSTILGDNVDSLVKIDKCDKNNIIDTSNTSTDIDDERLLTSKHLINSDVKETMALEKNNGMICLF